MFGIDYANEGRGLRDYEGRANLPSRPNSAADNWGKRRDLLKVAKISEETMMSSGKLPRRRPRTPPKPVPRLSADEVVEVDNFVLAYQNRTGDAIRKETPSQAYSRHIKNIENMTRTQKRNELLKRGAHKNNLNEAEQIQRLQIVYTKEVSDEHRRAKDELKERTQRTNSKGS